MSFFSMPDYAAPWVQAGGSVLGTVLANRAQATEGHLNREMQSHEAHTQRAFLSSQYQRMVADMRAAGLNPALAFGQGPSGGVSAMPSGSSAQYGSPDFSNFASGVTSAKQLAEIQKENLELDKALKAAETQRQQSEASLNATKEGEVAANIANLNESVITQKALQGVHGAHTRSTLEKLYPEIGLIDAQTALARSGAGLASAQALHEKQKQIRTEQEVYEKGLSHKVGRYTGVFDKLFESALRGVGVGVGTKLGFQYLKGILTPKTIGFGLR